ncbi:hypothetical protein ABK864_05045 [Serratia marcescens]|uniref:Uncharacterized protein n=1 Tax=Serratia marcescens subsp. marcescens Db11 TaxID=273526 RepID=A0ABC9IG35_SERMA|nr:MULTISPECIES: hypothetical protein [Serratia]MDI9262253.1 hypothetical protein [Serratia sp. PF2-63]EMB2733282.1 hypothetical protein [Serratia marcescens]KAB1580413.1 hypothetical protein F7687_14855 [Serratia marcescens]MBE5257567.1 hypothetical protein [Serratia marcescens]MBE5303916.1 hypothetical protein [Serratia marcescens]
MSGIKKTPESHDGLPSPSEDYDTFKHLSDVGAVLGYGRTRFYQWCRGRGFLTPMNVPSHEMISLGYMVAVLSETGHTRVYVTQDGFSYVSGAFAADIQRGMVKF